MYNGSNKGPMIDPCGTLHLDVLRVFGINLYILYSVCSITFNRVMHNTLNTTCVWLSEDPETLQPFYLFDTSSVGIV